MPPLHDSILQTIGNTPVVRLNRLAPDGYNLFVKLEAFNPMASVKDRMALSTIEAAEASGDLRPGQTVIEATSGNTGIGLAMVCAAKGYPLVLTMSESFSIERRKILRFLGAQVVLTPAELKGSGMLEKAVELAEAHDWLLVRQFENEANADAHTRSTALEILADFADTPLDFFLTGYGTGGTLKGTGRVLREQSPGTRIVVCEPDNSPVLGSGIAQAREADGSVSESHPAWRPHLMQGWTPDFVPRLVEDAQALELVDEVMPINGDDAMACARDLARLEGIFCGISSGATVAGALRLCDSAPRGSTLLAMVPDTGERYLSTPMFDDILAEMSAEEVEISQSTPGARFDSKPAPRPQEQEEEHVILTEKAVSSFEAAISDSENPVVLFSLEWCEFCWSVKKLFNKLGIPYVAMPLDSVAFQEGGLGGEIRAVLTDRLGTPTIPQVFINGEHIGGATDTFEALSDGTLATRLDEVGIALGELDEDFNPYSMLPGWLHAR